MRQWLERTLPTDDTKRKWFAILFTVLVAGAFTLLGIYALHSYGIALFILIPIFIGLSPVIIYGLKKQITKKIALGLAALTLFIYAAGLFLFAIEGAICIAMAAPIGLCLAWIGSLIGYALVSKMPGNAPAAMLLLTGVIPTTAFIEQHSSPSLTSVTTSIEINAPPQEVWKNVVAFPELDLPTELIFKAGIAYPVDARIGGSGVGAVRHCNFTTGSFVEPITIWEEPRLLKFDVAEQPEPMKEISFWDINAPHLHDYFVSKRGQFKLTTLRNGHTLLEGTTWYYHNIKPEFYWHIWSNYIIHKIHKRVLTHIKKNTERK